MTAPTLLLAHGSGWDERVAVLVPLAGLVVAGVGAASRGRTRAEGTVALPAAVRRRRAVAGVLAACFVVLDIVALGLLDLGERATAVVRNLLFPGLGLFDVSTPLALAFMAVALLAVAAWTRWGTDWVVATVWAGSILTAVVLVEPAAAEPELDEAARLLVASHEFALVMVAIAFIVRVRTWLANLPGIRRLRRRDRSGRPTGLLAVGELRSVDRARVAAIVAIAERLGGPTGDRDVVLAALDRTECAAAGPPRRCRRPMALRWRPAPGRQRARPAPRCRCGVASPSGRRRTFRQEADRRWSGVPASEPTWVRLLDGTLAAAALAELGEDACVQRWGGTWTQLLGLRKGHRPSCLYTPLAVGGAWAPAWEHAAASALGHVLGWGGDADWPALRQRALGAAARGPARPEDERLIAASRIWATAMADEQALRILTRPTVGRDPLAVALDGVASALVAGPSPSPSSPSPSPSSGPQQVLQHTTRSTDQHRSAVAAEER